MSCGNDPEAVAEEGEQLMPKRWGPSKQDPKLCHRCKSARAVYLARSLASCKACFLSGIRQRMVRHLYPPLRAPVPSSSDTSTGPRKGSAAARSASSLRPPTQAGQVLVAVSGGAGSMAMLSHLVEGGYVGTGDGKRADRTKGEKDVLWDYGSVVYVEFAGVTGMEDRVEEMRQLAKRMGMGFIGVRAEEAYDASLEDRLCEIERGVESHLGTQDNGTIETGPSRDVPPLERLRAFLASLSPASRPSALQAILDHILTTVATSLPDVSHLLLGETSTREAQRVISGTALGRGWALPLELLPSRPIRLEESSGEGVSQRSARIIRIKPMKDITLKEAAIYCHVKGLATTNERRFASGETKGSRGKAATSLEMLTERFIAGLSVSHPSTVSTINKTGDKLVFAGNANSLAVCPFCNVPAEPSASAWKARTSLTSLGKIPDQSTLTETPAPARLESLLCYACHTTLYSSEATRKSAGSAAQLISPLDPPPWVAASAQRVMAREEIADEIREYFIHDDANGDQ